MNLSCPQASLAQALDIVSRSAARNHPLPILSNVLFTAEPGRLSLTTTNLETHCHTWCAATVEEPGAITIPHKKLADLIKALPSDRRIDLALTGEAETPALLEVRCHRSLTHLNGAPADDYPRTPTDLEGPTVTLNGHELAQAINSTAHAAATDDSRPTLQGIQVGFNERQLTFVATDGFRLAIYEHPLEHDLDPLAITVPATALREVRRLLAGSNEKVTITIAADQKQVSFQIGATTLVSQLILGTYPNWERLQPAKYDTRAVFDHADFTRVLKTATVFAKDSNNTIRLFLNPTPGEPPAAPGELQITAMSENYGNSLSALSVAEFAGEYRRIAFNHQYLSDFTSNVGKGKIALEISGPSDPGVLRPADSEHYQYILMPMYVQWEPIAD